MRWRIQRFRRTEWPFVIFKHSWVQCSLFVDKGILVCLSKFRDSIHMCERLELAKCMYAIQKSWPSAPPEDGWPRLAARKKSNPFGRPCSKSFWALSRMYRHRRLTGLWGRPKLLQLWPCLQSSCLCFVIDGSFSFTGWDWLICLVLI
jgi:hypothetical protein